MKCGWTLPPTAWATARQGFGGHLRIFKHDEPGTQYAERRSEALRDQIPNLASSLSTMFPRSLCNARSSKLGGRGIHRDVGTERGRGRYTLIIKNLPHRAGSGDRCRRSGGHRATSDVVIVPVDLPRGVSPPNSRVTVASSRAASRTASGLRFTHDVAECDRRGRACRDPETDEGARPVTIALDIVLSIRR